MALPPLALRLALSGVLAVAAWDVGRKALADSAFREQTPEGVDRAIALDGRDTRFLLARSLLLDRQGAGATPPLERAAELSPRDDLIWQRLGLQRELEGRIEEAERSLLRAAELSRKYEPRWTLANFYFRQGRRDEFWKWARAGLESGWPDPRPLFDLCRALESNLEEVERKAVPDNPRMKVLFALYLADQGRLDLVEARAAGLEPPGAELDGIMAHLVDRLLAGYRTQAADHVRRTLNRPELFERRGFDWSGPAVRTQAGWRIEWNGDQPETLDVLARIAAVDPGRPYRLRWRSETRLSSPAGALRSSGVRWIVQEWTREAAPVAASGELPVSGGGGGSVEFRGPRVGGVRLALEYRRPSGSMRAEGAVEVMQLEVEPVSP